MIYMIEGFEDVRFDEMHQQRQILMMDDVQCACGCWLVLLVWMVEEEEMFLEGEGEPLSTRRSLRYVRDCDCEGLHLRCHYCECGNFTARPSEDA